jgi:glycopeptide antibiotics resistance protein
MSDVGKQASSGDRRVPLGALFVIYLLMLLWLVLWKLEVPWIGGGPLRRIRLVPFVASAGAGASTPREVVANVVLFLPFGVYLSLLAPGWGWWKKVGVVAGASAVIEVTQYALAIGSADITDVITNTAGGLAGIGLFVVMSRKLQARTTAVMTRTCLVTTVLALLLTGIFLASGLRYGPPRGGATPAHGLAGTLTLSPPQPSPAPSCR